MLYDWSRDNISRFNFFQIVLFISFLSQGRVVWRFVDQQIYKIDTNNLLHTETKMSNSQKKLKKKQ